MQMYLVFRVQRGSFAFFASVSWDHGSPGPNRISGATLDTALCFNGGEVALDLPLVSLDGTIIY